MAFFRKWKTHYKHKKFTSDEALDNEDWGLDKPVMSKDLASDIKLNLSSIEQVHEKAREPLGGDDGEDDEKSMSQTYDIKYLGCTPIETKRSEKVISEAIKTVISNSKAGGRKNKTHRRVKLNISTSGLEVLDHQSQESLMRISVYQICYCSVDAAHDHAFSFVASEKNPLSEQPKLSCHVFHCAKRKMAHEITLMVARCFENAFQHWRDTVVEHAKTQGISLNESADLKKMLKESSGGTIIEAQVDVHTAKLSTGHALEDEQQQQLKQQQQRADNLLIDFAAAAAATDSDMRTYLQNTWVSFDDEPRDNVRIMAF